MTPVAKRLPYHCLPEFFEVINAYGAYIRERDVVRQTNKKDTIPSALSRELSLHTVDTYSWQYREHGSDDGISESAKCDIEKKVNDILKEEKELRTKNLISTQKYYKKLKHEFKENNPALIEMFDIALGDHQSYMENKKRIAYHKHNDILGLSPRFIAFFNYNFNGGDSCRIAYNSFAKFLRKRTSNLGMEDDQIKSLHDKLGTDSNRISNYKLTFDDIELLAITLKTFVSSINERDTQNIERYINNIEDGNMPIEEKKAIALSIINKNIERFSDILSAMNYRASCF